jgi:hypothetical protein
VNRTPPVEVRRVLRREVGFGCPVDGCGNPYLYWHHFDPPWSEREHHEPEGMVALCGEHHSKADAGAYTKAQLRQLKEHPYAKERAVAGRFDWLRHELLVVVGGNFYLQTSVAVQFRDQPAIWLSRDESGHALLNVSMLSRTPEQPRLTLHESFWLSQGQPDDLECPPSGRLVAASYPGGDSLRVEFFELIDAQALPKRYPDAQLGNRLPVPMTAVEVQMSVGGTGLSFGPRESRLPGKNVMRNCVMSNCVAGLVIS